MVAWKKVAMLWPWLWFEVPRLSTLYQYCIRTLFTSQYRKSGRLTIKICVNIQHLWFLMVHSQNCLSSFSVTFLPWIRILKTGSNSRSGQNDLIQKDLDSKTLLKSILKLFTSYLLLFWLWSLFDNKSSSVPIVHVHSLLVNIGLCFTVIVLSF